MLEMLPWSNFTLCTVEKIILPLYIGTPCSSNIYFRICHKIFIIGTEQRKTGIMFAL